jgi:D-serine deaminase-like pyridoxal phosphate-dependent protein
MHPRYALNHPEMLLSPSLLVFRPLVRRNLETMVSLARSAERLRPHVKTHKMPALIRMAEQEYGIRKHKAATIAEAEMVALAGGSDVLLAYPMVGPNIARLARLVASYPETTFRATVDDPYAARALSAGLEGSERPLSVLLDLDLGMGRTGIVPGNAAADLFDLVADLPNLQADGLHAYDGHLHQTDLEERRAAARDVQQRLFAFWDDLRSRGHMVHRVVLGGTPTFPMHAELDAPGLELSPGTCVLHDAGYGSKHPDLPFVAAALLLTRVVSRPRPGRLCLDLGHKAVAADPVGARLTLLGVPDATLGKQNEEHLVVETPHAPDFPLGTPLLAIPTHICPTCALHRRAYVIEDGQLVDEWEVAARDRVIGV